MTIAFKVQDSDGGKELNVPCGNCIGCLMARAKAWAGRCMHEASLYDQNCFITLTYNDASMPHLGSLDISDFQGFMKRLRKRFGEGIRYFACGEYGPVNLRPHYHALLFNHDFDDRVLFKETEAGSPIFLSEELQRLWPAGYSSVTDVTLKSANYVARYNMKKAMDPLKLPDGISREFIVMSRGSKKLGTGGIGKGWYDKYKGDVYPADEVILSGGQRMRPPRYYDNLLQREDPDLLESLKVKRKRDGTKLVPYVLPTGRTILVNDNDSFRLPVKEEVFRAGISQLKRGQEI